MKNDFECLANKMCDSIDAIALALKEIKKIDKKYGEQKWM